MFQNNVQMDREAGPRPRHYFSHRGSGPPVHFTQSDFNYFIILGISSDGINAIVTHKGAMPPPPPNWLASKTKEERKRKKKSQQEDLQLAPWEQAV